MTILSGVEDHDVDPVLELTRKECRSCPEILPATALRIFEELPPGEMLPERWFA